MNKIEEIEYEWQMYRKNVIEFLSDLKPEYFISKESSTDINNHIMFVWTELKDIENAKGAFKILKLHLEPNQLEVLRTRYRSYKYRSKNNRKTVVVSDFIRQKLTDAMKSINSDSVDECIDYLTSELYIEHRDEAVHDIRDNLYGNEGEALKSLLLRLSKRDEAILKASMEATFLKGWNSGRTSRSKKSDANKIAMERYMKTLFSKQQ
jgi:hypothetical protein